MDSAKRQVIVDAMAEAWRTWGVFLVVNHGVEQEVAEGAREQAMRVFALPIETKHKAIREPGGFAGYGNGAGTTISQSAEYGNESVRVHHPGPDTRNLGEKLWPDDTEDFCEKFEAYISASEKLTRQIIELRSEGLPEVDRPHILRYFPEPCEGALRLNYYPISTTLGLPSHADIAALALLHQCDGGGRLQVQKGGEWVNVQSCSDAFVVIMGTVFQIFANGDHKACQYRAIQGGYRDRLSVVFSLWPDPLLPMIPAPIFLEAHKQHLRYKPLTFPEYWNTREANLLEPLNCIAVDAT